MTDKSLNTQLARFFSHKFPGVYYFTWLTATFLIFMAFDILWCNETTFVPMYTSRFAYLCAFCAATVLSLPAALSRRSWIQVVILVLLSVLLEANLMYCRTYATPIPVSSYALAGNLSDFTGSIYDSLRWYDLIFVLIIVIAILLSHRIRPILLPSKKFLVIFVAIIILAIGGLFYIQGGFKNKIRESYGSFTEYMIPTNYTLFSYIAYDYMMGNSDLTKDEENKVSEWISHHNNIISDYIYEDNMDSTLAQPRNIVMIICESLEPWPINLVLEEKAITPYLNNLISDTSVYYNPNVVTQVRGGRSIDCQLMALAGMLPINSGSYSYKYTGSMKYSIPKAVKELSMKSHLFSTDKKYVWNQTTVAHDMGFDELISRENWDINDKASLNSFDGYMNDGALFSQSIEKIRTGEIWGEGESNFTVWITHSGHNPFKVDDKMDILHLSDNYPEVLRDYLTATAYVDSSLATLIEYLKTRNDWENTVVIITGDHEGLAGYRDDIAGKRQFNFVSKEQFVPLIIVNYPGLSGRDDKVMGQVDIYSTLLDILRIYDSYPWKGMGYSVMDANRPGFAFGSQGQLVGNIDDGDNSIVEHQREAYSVSDLIMRFNLLEKYY